jgi:hypothetical protein
MAKIIYNRHIPFGSYLAINLFGIIFVKSKRRLSRRELNHELIHSRQQAEMLWVFFYLWYALEWFFRLVQYRSTTRAYYNISFEREAYANEKDLLYRRRRGFWAWISYLNRNEELGIRN